MSLLQIGVFVALAIPLVGLLILDVTLLFRRYTRAEMVRGVLDGLRRLGLVLLLAVALGLGEVWIHAHIPLRDSTTYTSAIGMLFWMGGAINAHIWRKRSPTGDW